MRLTSLVHHYGDVPKALHCSGYRSWRIISSIWIDAYQCQRANFKVNDIVCALVDVQASASVNAFSMSM